MTSQADIDRQVADLRRHNALYRAGKPEISDMDYDALVEALRALDPQNAWLHQVEPEQLPGSKVRHGTPMLSTEKAYTREQLQRWVDRVHKAGAELSITDIEFKITPKLDGLAGLDEGGILATRGNGRVGTDITRAYGRGVVPVSGRNLGKGEIVISLAWFTEHAKGEFDHPRNMCVGIISADTINPTAQRALDAGAVRFVPYTTLPTWRGTGTELVERTGEITDSLRQVDYALDGMVAETTNSELRAHMGATSHHNRWQIAIKERGETAETTVNNIAWQTGRTGNITPVLLVEPVKLSGATISRVTGHHAGMVRDRALGAGCRIRIIRSGEVIPKLEEVLKPAEQVILPEVCPSCSNTLIWVNDFLNCDNGPVCPAQVETGLRHWFKTLSTADNWGPKTITRVVAAGYVTLEQLYAITGQDLLDLGFGDGQTANLLAALTASRNEQVEDARFLAAFGIKDLGVGDSRKLLQSFRLENLHELDADRLLQVKGFGEVTSRSIVDGLKARWSTITHMMALGFNLERTPLASEAPKVDSPIAGKRILFTGKMVQGSRDEMKDQARDLGAVLASSISKNLDLLVIGEKASPSKISKAEKADVQILTEAAYLALLATA
jgi:DNA ligase (NAD+)